VAAAAAWAAFFAAIRCAREVISSSVPVPRRSKSSAGQAVRGRDLPPDGVGLSLCGPLRVRGRGFLKPLLLGLAELDEAVVLGELLLLRRA
jgi:hypothetical protein